MKRWSMMVLALTALASALATIATSATASPVFYSIRFDVASGVVCHLEPPPPFPNPPVCDTNAAGNVYFGFFGVDSAVLDSDGLCKPANVITFVIQMEDNIWGYNFPVNNSFTGFRGPGPGGEGCFALGAASPGFDVVGGTIVGLGGGVHGSGDIPFVDFHGSSFVAYGQAFRGPADFVYPAFGSMVIARISEPATLVLFGIAVAGIALVRRRPLARQQRS